MGWEPWNIDHCGGSSNWDETYYKKLADFFVSSGLKDLGYTYITFECDDVYRDTNGVLLPNFNKFHSGLKPINDYLHSKGLKSRAYTDAGKGKCAGCFNGDGSFGHYAADAKSWVEWGFDGVKIDWCGGDKEKLDPKKQFMEFHKEMARCNPVFNIEICTWGRGNPWEWGREAGTFWRTGHDDDGGTPLATGSSWKDITINIDANRHPDKKWVGPGLGWNYADILCAGIKGGLNETEQRMQFSMWCMMASPLFLGNDVFNMSPSVKDIVMNKEMIAIDQDPLGIQGDVVKEYHNGTLQVWMKELSGGDKAVALFNRSEQTEKITVNWKDVGVTGTMKVRDLWEHADKGMFTETYAVDVVSHAAVVIRISPQ